MLINLIPDFFALLDSSDPVAAYRRYYTSHLRILEPYWRNYVLDPDTSSAFSSHTGATTYSIPTHHTLTT